MPLPADATKIHMDAVTDDPQLARAELADLVDKFNLLLAAFGNTVELNIGNGLAANGGNLVVSLGTNPGLILSSSKLLAKVGSGNKLTTNGIETDINGLTAETVVDDANDFGIFYDASASVLRKIPMGNFAKPGGWVFLEKKIANADANLSFTSNIDNAYTRYRCVFEKVQPVNNNVTLQVQVSTNGGTSYLSSSYGYGLSLFGQTGADGTAEGSTNATGFDISASGLYPNAGAVHGNGVFELIDPSSATFRQRAEWMCHYGTNLKTEGWGEIGTAAINAFQFKFSSGNIAGGTFRLYGLTES